MHHPTPQPVRLSITVDGHPRNVTLVGNGAASGTAVSGTAASGITARNGVVGAHAGTGLSTPIGFTTPGEFSAPAALLFFHGSLQSGNVARAFTAYAFDRLAAQVGAGASLIVAYPDGVHHHFNDLRRDLKEKTRIERVDDVAFTRAIIDALVHDFGVDRGRIFACGFSNGGHMVFRLLHEAPGLFAGAAVFAASMPTEANTLAEVARCTPRPTPLLLMHGTDDRVSPIGGGQFGIDGRMRGEVRSARATAEYFAAVNRAGEPVTRRCGSITVSTWPSVEGAGEAAGNSSGGGSCDGSGDVTAASAPVELWEIEGMGHYIPAPGVKTSRFLGGGAGNGEAGSSGAGNHRTEPVTAGLDGAQIAARFFGITAHPHAPRR